MIIIGIGDFYAVEFVEMVDQRVKLQHYTLFRFLAKSLLGKDILITFYR